MFWKRFAPMVLAVAVTAMVSAAASHNENRGQTPFFNPATCTIEKNGVCPRFSFDRIALRAL